MTRDQDEIQGNSENDALGQPQAEDGGAAAPGQDQKLAALQAERDELESRLLRLAADYQNYARRSQASVSEARDQQVFDLARSLLSVLDHFDLALAVDPQRTAIQDVLKGVQMVHTELLSVLEKFGIKTLEVAPGASFDPNLHQALSYEKVEGVAAGHVARMLQRGYLLGDKVVRPAQVTVAQ